MQIKQQFVVAHSRAIVWDSFGQIDEVTLCVPGASLTEPATGNLAKFKLNVKLGPIGAEFVGEAELEREPNDFRGTIRGSGRDNRSNSRVKGEIEYTLSEEAQGKATRVDLSVDFSLTGRLAQFGRTGIVNDLAARLTADFANNLERALSAQHAPGEPASARQSSDPEATGRTIEFDVGGHFVSVMWSRIKALLRSILGRS